MTALKLLHNDEIREAAVKVFKYRLAPLLGFLHALPGGADRRPDGTGTGPMRTQSFKEAR